MRTDAGCRLTEHNFGDKTYIFTHIDTRASKEYSKSHPGNTPGLGGLMANKWVIVFFT